MTSIRNTPAVWIVYPEAMRHLWAVLTILLLTSTSWAREIRDGANHRLGDESFVARFGRMPADGDGEALRMRVHLEYARDLLATRPATAPEFAARRAELLRYLGDYIAKGITPNNTYVARRNPVFIDRDGNVCAVGYLIERSVGRALPEAIAATHRLDYLEDIASAMPAVAAWVRTSGFTLDELASIQPGYEGPEVMHVNGWTVADIKDGAYRETQDGTTMVGAFKNKQMVGSWTRTIDGNKDGAPAKLVGSGTFKNGAGTWTSFRADGSRMAEGPFARSRAEGTWKFFHPSGRLAAVGTMHKGKRDGTWTLYYDAKGSVKLTSGQFINGDVVGDWKHFDSNGKLVATAKGAAWIGLVLRVEPGKDGVRHDIHQGIPASSARLDGFSLGGDRLYIKNRAMIYDGNGNHLDKVGGAWVARDCKWSAKRKQAAKVGDVTTLHKLLGYSDGEGSEEGCDGPVKAVAAAQVKHIETMLASRRQTHAPIPTFAVSQNIPVAADSAADGADADAEADAPIETIAGVDNPGDMATYLADHMTWYAEWPYVDDTFVAVYQSMPGYAKQRDL